MNKVQRSQRRLEMNSELEPFVPGTKILNPGYKYGRGDNKGKIIHVATNTVIDRE